MEWALPRTLMVYESTTLNMNRYQSITSLGSPNGVSVDVLGAIRLIQLKRLRILPSLRCSVLKSSGAPWKNLRKYRWYPHRYSKNTHTFKNNNEKCSRKICKGSPTPKLGGEMSSSRVVSMRYHSN